MLKFLVLPRFLVANRYPIHLKTLLALILRRKT